MYLGRILCFSDSFVQVHFSKSQMSEVRKSAICVLHSIIHSVDENKVEQIGLKYFLKEHHHFNESDIHETFKL